jgi:hypothetical protein
MTMLTCNVLAIVLAAAMVGAPASGQFWRSKTEFKTFKDPAGRFVLEYPNDWQLVDGVGEVIATFRQKKGEAALVVERRHLNLPVGKDDINENLKSVETDVLRERQATASDVVSKIVDKNDTRLIVIDYKRTGLTRAEQVRQYSFPVGQDIYRLVCSSAVGVFTKYEVDFTHVADSFRVLPLAPTK